MNATESTVPTSINVEAIRWCLQKEYDRHYDHYRRGCSGCIVAVWAIRDVAKKLGIKIKESV